MHILPLEPSVQCTLSQKQGAEGHKKENWKGWNNAFIGWFSVPCYESKPFQRFLSQIFLKQVRISSEKDWCSHQYPYGGILAQVAAVLLTFMFLLIWSHGQSINQFISNSVYTGCLYKLQTQNNFSGHMVPTGLRHFLHQYFHITAKYSWNLILFIFISIIYFFIFWSFDEFNFVHFPYHVTFIHMFITFNFLFTCPAKVAVVKSFHV